MTLLMVTPLTVFPKESFRLSDRACADPYIS